MARKTVSFWRTVAAVAVAGVCAGIGSAQKNLPDQREFKNLAGPATEIEQMRLPEPATLGSRSKSAMFPISGEGESQEFVIPVDSTDNFRLMLLTPNSAEMSVAAALGEKDEYRDLRATGQNGLIRRFETSYGLDGNQFPAEVFMFESLKSATVRVRIELSKSLRGTPVAGYLVASSDSPFRAYSYVDTLRTTVGREIGVVGSVFDSRTNGEEGSPDSLFGVIREARVVFTTPGGKLIERSMETTSDQFRGTFVPTEPGRYTAQTILTGITPDGAPFIRTSELAFEVAGSTLAVGRRASAVPQDEYRTRLTIPVAGVRTGRNYVVHAELWNRLEDGTEVPVSWLGGMTRAARLTGRNSGLPLTLDTRWLAGTENTKALVLRNIRVQDADTSVVIGESEEIILPPIEVSDAARSFFGLETDEMRQGPRPANLPENAVGGRLMLVHGYCSGDAWGPAAAAGQFTNFVKFLDLNQNRTHDQFAQRIRNFGATLPSFGIVAHSQGGAASLHLYTYYWSGLDSATGSRLIQSVGTPYRGTALAGNLAILGQIFGAGCGSNNDLTYSGAAAWLANIPTWARAKVSYHTTSFTDVWWRYDYCQLATDPFLSDPDDGVVERTFAQLSGGINLGHKTGWCHSTGMRDPAQTGDSARNANMNANAAR